MLELKSVTKRFGNTLALDRVSLRIAAGEIHGLVGLNGSGKSTLLNILFGSRHIAESGGYQGEVHLNGDLCRFRHPADAIARGIGMVHQELAVIPEMSVAANVCLTREATFAFGFSGSSRSLRSLCRRLMPSQYALIDEARTRRAAEETLGHMRRVGGMAHALDPLRKVGSLSVSLKQFVEVAREISRAGLRLLLLDEPTAVLGGRDAAGLAALLRDVAAQGAAILFVSHRLDEVLSVCHRLTVLRDGCSAGSFAAGSCNVREVANLMVREEVRKARKMVRSNTSKPILRLRGFSVKMPSERLDNLDLDVQEGEILGVTSLSGQGKAALGPGVMGLQPFRGRLSLAGETRKEVSSREMIRRGVFYVPEERRRHGLLLHHSVMDNIVFGAMQNRGRFLKGGRLGWLRLPDTRAVRAFADRSVEDFAIRCADIDQKTCELSGGNQQKICLAHALALEPSLLLIGEPTRGIDIAAKERILDLLIAANTTRGTTIVMISSELEELRRICDRIVVLYKGRISALLPPTAAEHEFARALSGEGSAW